MLCPVLWQLYSIKGFPEISARGANFKSKAHSFSERALLFEYGSLRIGREPLKGEIKRGKAVPPLWFMLPCGRKRNSEA